MAAHADMDGAFSDIHQRLVKYIESNPSAMIDLALVQDNKIIWASHYGDKSSSGEYVYRTGSITKILTALAIMQLEDQGMIDIDQPVYAYLPRFSVKRRFSDANPITIRHLLTHHSGLPTNIVKGQWSHAHFSTVIEQLRNEYMSYPPDFVQAYSNIGYSLLGSIIEEVTSQSYESYIEENILHPLGMLNSSFDADTINRPEFAQPLSKHRSQQLLPIRDIPAMGLYTTAKDMAQFLMMLANAGQYKGKSITHQSVLEEMMERNNEQVALDYDHEAGIGFLLNHCVFDQRGNVVEHGGQTMHYASHFLSVPKYGVGAVVLSNSERAKKFVHVLARDLVAQVLENSHPVNNSKPSVITNNQQVEVSERQEGKKRGKYLTKSGLLTLQVDESDMCACVSGKRLDLVPAPEGWYGIKGKKGLSGIEFSPQQVDGQPVVAVRKDDKEERLGEYIPEKGIPARWRTRLGNYQVENPDMLFPFKDVRLIEDDNLMYLSYRMPLLSDKRIDLPLTALDDEQAITTGLGRGRGETLLAEQTAEGEFLLYSGYLVKKVADDEIFSTDDY
jgi:CubicO group peptidase (beta-lactamase class C family)